MKEYSLKMKNDGRSAIGDKVGLKTGGEDYIWNRRKCFSLPIP